MKKRNGLMIWAKRAVFALALAGTGLMAGCEKKTEDPYSQPIDPVKVLPFGARIDLDSIQYENVMKYANDPRITTIIYFLDSTNQNNNFTGFATSNISILRGTLSDRLNYTTKATGAGTFIFRPGAASPEDSLWFVQNGWKIRTW
ncbi:MAG: hypothetical protein NC048_07245 [Bacteroides sp.]|nr:hypothetical protein [Ruminococcus flavefaciens]MCM1555275.1 hypothetical protein [Bacteroides sp.]